jgi:hypothetical protein
MCLVLNAHCYEISAFVSLIKSVIKFSVEILSRRSSHCLLDPSEVMAHPGVNT